MSTAVSPTSTETVAVSVTYSSRRTPSCITTRCTGSASSSSFATIAPVTPYGSSVAPTVTRPACAEQIPPLFVGGDAAAIDQGDVQGIVEQRMLALRRIQHVTRKPAIARAGFDEVKPVRARPAKLRPQFRQLRREDLPEQRSDIDVREEVSLRAPSAGWRTCSSRGRDDRAPTPCSRRRGIGPRSRTRQRMRGFRDTCDELYRDQGFGAGGRRTKKALAAIAASAFRSRPLACAWPTLSLSSSSRTPPARRARPP